MKTINVLVRDKIASAVGDIVYICGNSDYVINFDFDAEWDDYDVKTARFVHDGSCIDVVFTGNQCAMPVIHKAYGIYVGVYAGDLRTTTPAHIPSAASILSTDGTPEAPPDDVYAQITELCNEAVSEAKSVRDDADAGKFNGAPGKTPEAGVDYFTEADKQSIAAEAATEVGFPRPNVSDNGKYLGCENGAAAWMPVEELKGADGKSAYQYAKDGGYTGTEAEFAEKLAAEKFANPAALKFTGAVTGSYDGSNPLTVKIPSGGGAGARTICVPTELESGIIPSGEAAWTSYKINTTLADIQEWDEFLVEWYGMTKSSFWGFKPTGRDIQDASWLQSSSKTLHLYEWVDSDHTHVRVKSYRSGVGGVINGIESNKGAIKSDNAFSVLCIADWSGVDPTTEMCFNHSAETNADITYKVWGIVKKEA